MALTLDDFNPIAARVPLLANLRPHGKYSFTQEFHAVGGVPVLMNVLLHAGLIHGDGTSTVAVVRVRFHIIRNLETMHD